MILTVLGISLVAFVFAAVLMLAEGLKQTLVSSGRDDNAIVIRESSNTEMSSFITRYQAGVLQTIPEIKLDEDGQPLIAGEVVMLINKNKIGTSSMANIPVRGIGPKSLKLRGNINIVAGRMMDFGKTEVIAGKKIANEFENCGLGDIITFGNTDWTVVGIYEAAGSAFESEIWGDVDQLLPAFGRPVFSSMTFRLNDPSSFNAMRERVMADPRMTVDLKPEKVYYAEQSRTMGTFIKVLGMTISIIFSIGAIIGAMITMYAAVANRTVEIATMRALGFKRRSILGAFLIESLVISILGGLVGLIAAAALQSLRISTINWDTFSNLSFGFHLSMPIAVSVMIFSIVMGILGGFLPAVRASRTKIIEALRAA